MESIAHTHNSGVDCGYILTMFLMIYYYSRDFQTQDGSTNTADIPLGVLFKLANAHLSE